MATRIVGPATWSMDRDDEGHRTYKLTLRIRGSTTDGPAVVLNTPGAPRYGDVWRMDGDEDPWAFCRQPVSITPITSDEPNREWRATYTFSSKPDGKRCKEESIEDPLLTPAEVSGGMVRYTEEATADRFGRPITNSAWEQMRGPQVEFDGSRPQIKIRMNVPSFAVVLIAMAMADHVNALPVWGVSRRCIKLSDVTFERKYYGACEAYYVLSMTFDVRFDTFDRDLLDEGTKVLHGHWDAVTGNWVLDNIGGLQTPRAPKLVPSAPGGHMLTGLYAYSVTALTADGKETNASPASSVNLNVAGATGKISLTWDSIAGAKSYRVYGRTLGGQLLLQSVNGTSWVDDGTAPGGAAPPAQTLAGGTKPDRTNPAHFTRFKDKNGENARCILDGFGTPAGVITQSGDYYISIVDNNTGNALTNAAKWVKIVPPFYLATAQIPWNPVQPYVVGNVVSDGPLGTVYLCVHANTSDRPPSANWLLMPNGVAVVGPYNVTTTYNKGFVVVTGVAGAGVRHVEKYQEADFTRIPGLPLVL